MSQYRIFDILLPLSTPFEVKLRLFAKGKSKQILLVLNDELFTVLNTDSLLREMVRKYNQAIITSPFLIKVASSNYFNHFSISWFIFLSKKMPFIIKFILFCIFFFIDWCILMLRVTFSSLFKVLFTNSLQLSLADPNLFAFDLLHLAQEEKKSVLIISDYEESDKVTLDLIKRLYPKLDIKTWERSFRSLQIIDESKSSTDNFYANNPRYWELRGYILDNPSNIILFTTKEILNASIFLEHIKKEEQISFDFASVYNAFNDSGKENKKSKLSFRKKVSIINQVVVDNFVQLLESKEQFNYVVKLELTMQDDRKIKSISGLEARIVASNETLNEVVKEMIISVSNEVSNFMLLSKPKVVKKSRIKANFASLAKNDMRFSREVEYTAKLQFNGEKSSIKDGWIII